MSDISAQQRNVEAIKPVRQTARRKGPLYKSLESAFRDVRDIMDGKQKKQTLGEFLSELS
ncbi:MAG: hypothetical protein LBJ47_10570 [Tannerella sp.]|jgi:hypothetical protein|nr:hypothetical protein [Tannerella sp.]